MTIAETIQAFIKGEFDKLQIYSEVATVTSVNELDRTCEAELLVGGKVYGIRLQSVIGNSNGFVQIPENNSKIVITFLNKSTGYVSLFSKVSKILIDTDLVQFNQGSLDGLVILQKIYDAVNRLETKYNAHIHGGVTTGAGVTAVTTTVIVPLTTKSGLENTKITQ